MSHGIAPEHGSAIGVSAYMRGVAFAPPVSTDSKDDPELLALRSNYYRGTAEVEIRCSEAPHVTVHELVMR